MKRFLLLIMALISLTGCSEVIEKDTKEEKTEDKWKVKNSDEDDYKVKDKEYTFDRTDECYNISDGYALSFHDFLYTRDPMYTVFFAKVDGELSAYYNPDCYKFEKYIKIDSIEEVDSVDIDADMFKDDIYGISTDNISIAFIGDYIIVNEGKELYKANVDLSGMFELFEKQKMDEEEAKDYQFPCSWYFQQIDNNWNMEFMKEYDNTGERPVDVKSYKFDFDKMIIETSKEPGYEDALCVLINGKYYYVPEYMTLKPYEYERYVGMANDVDADLEIEESENSERVEFSIIENGPLKKGTYRKYFKFNNNLNYFEFTID